MKNMNANDWRNELEELYAGLKSGKIKPPTACEMNNTAGKVIALAKLELEYARLRRESPTIPLLAGTPLAK